MPLAEVELGLREGGSHRRVEATVVVADHPLRGAVQAPQERFPVGLGGLREDLNAPELGALILEPHRAEDLERDPEPAGGRVAHREGQVVKQQRARRRPCGRPVRLEDHWCEDLDPVHYQLAVAGQALLARVGVTSQPVGPLARNQRRMAVGRPGSHRRQRLGDAPRHELVVAGGVWALV